MSERQVGIREFKSTLSECVREVRTGGTIVVTDRGRPVARLIPGSTSLAERLHVLRKAGTIAWSGRRLRRPRQIIKTVGRKAVSDILVENRK